MNIYTPSLVQRCSHTLIRWTRSRIDQAQEEVGGFCTVRDLAPAVLTMSLFSAPLHTPTPPSGFMDILIKWGCT